MGSNNKVPGGIDPAVPWPARMYDYFLGGKDNFQADRYAAEKVLSAVPHGRKVAWPTESFSFVLSRRHENSRPRR